MGSILGLLQSLWYIIVNVLQSFLLAIRTVIGSIDFVFTFVAYVPAVISSAVLIFLAVFALRFLLLK